MILDPIGLLLEYVNQMPETCRNEPFVPSGNESTEISSACLICLPVSCLTTIASSIIFIRSENHSFPCYRTQSFLTFPELQKAISASMYCLNKSAIKLPYAD